jgi:hypothetical protein
VLKLDFVTCTGGIMKRLFVLFLMLSLGLKVYALEAECSRWVGKPVMYKCSNGKLFVYGNTDCKVEGKKTSATFCSWDQKDNLEECIKTHLVFDQMFGSKCYSEFKAKRSDFKRQSKTAIHQISGVSRKPAGF